MKIIDKLIIDGKLNPELQDLKCYVIINKSCHGMGLGGGYSVYKVQIYSCSRDNVLSYQMFRDRVDKDSVLVFNNRECTGYNKLVTCDSEAEAERLSRLFSKYGYISDKNSLEKLSSQISEMQSFYSDMFGVLHLGREKFDATRIDNDDREHRKYIEYVKDKYPKFLSSLDPKKETKHYRGSCVYLVYVDNSGIGHYHYPDNYGCWDTEIELIDQKFIGRDVLNGKEWFPTSEDQFLSAFDTRSLENMTSSKLSYLTKGLYK